MEAKTLEIDPRLKDKQWRVSHLYKIVDKQGKLVTFKPNLVQSTFESQRWVRNIIVKGRQLGFTTYACVDGLDDVLFNKNFPMVIIAHDLESMSKIFNKVKIAWDNFPQIIKDELGFVAETDRANELSFNNGSSIRVALSSRSDTIRRLHITELAKISVKYPLKAQEVLSGAIPSVPMGCRIDIESTSEGPIGEFYDMFMSAYENEPVTPLDYRHFFFCWTQSPEYTLDYAMDVPQKFLDIQHKHKLTDGQIKWYYNEWKTQKERMKYEYPLTIQEAFQSAEGLFFDQDIVNRYESTPGEVIGGWTYYKEYRPGHVYGMGVDVSEGIGKDGSAIAVLDFSTVRPQLVAEYWSRTIEPDNLAYEIRAGGLKYGTCLVAVERNNHGHATLVKLKELYPVDAIYKEILYNKEDNTETERLGWPTNVATKPKLLYEFKKVVEDEMIVILSARLIKDLQTYVKDDVNRSKALEDQVAHWDLLIATCIAFQMRLEAHEVSAEATTHYANSKSSSSSDPRSL